MSQRFSLGQLLVTPGALARADADQISSFVSRHAQGDWGDLDDEDKQANHDALLEGERLLSAYHTPDGTKFYVITEWDRSVTTIMLASDY